jgi:hypothetical protein
MNSNLDMFVINPTLYKGPSFSLCTNSKALNTFVSHVVHFGIILRKLDLPRNIS